MVKGAKPAIPGTSQSSKTHPRRTSKKPTTPDPGEATTNSSSNTLQQACLDIFRQTLHPGPEDSDILQTVKGHLYQRDFASAFGSHESLRVYASRWSPSRALAYLQLFNDLKAFLVGNIETSTTTDHPQSTRIVCFGGGAGGELVAAAAWWSQNSGDDVVEGDRLGGRLDLDLVDIADWSTTISQLEKSITVPLILSKYASQAKKDANKALLDADCLLVNFHRQDVLELDEDRLGNLMRGARLVTFMFTLNELYSTSLPKTQQLLQRLKALMTPGTLLLVVDSPGSYSTVAINGNEKKYPMQWLLEYTLLGPPKSGDQDGGDAKWEKVVSDESRWFRLPTGLQYPIELENMRYQLHLLRKICHGRMPDTT